jgi:transcriptional repressor NrdR
MRCPFCGHEETRVSDKREIEEGMTTRRRRECLSCKKRFTTYEEIEKMELSVIKRDDKRQPFNKQKLLAGFLKACEKRPISREQIEQAVNEIEQEILNMETKEIPSRVMGELVMNKLKKMDKVAYIRFASVYKQFEDIDDFKKELDALISKKSEK